MPLEFPFLQDLPFEKLQPGSIVTYIFLGCRICNPADYNLVISVEDCNPAEYDLANKSKNCNPAVIVKKGELQI
jgi:hypothetical protein